METIVAAVIGALATIAAAAIALHRSGRLRRQREAGVPSEADRAAPAVIMLHCTYGGVFIRGRIFVDGSEVAAIREQQKQRIEVSPGEHTVWIHRAGRRSDPVSFTLQAGQTMNLKCELSHLAGNHLSFE